VQMTQRAPVGPRALLAEARIFVLDGNVGSEKTDDVGPVLQQPAGAPMHTELVSGVARGTRVVDGLYRAVRDQHHDHVAGSAQPSEARQQIAPGGVCLYITFAVAGRLDRRPTVLAADR